MGAFMKQKAWESQKEVAHRFLAYQDVYNSWAEPEPLTRAKLVQEFCSSTFGSPVKYTEEVPISAELEAALRPGPGEPEPESVGHTATEEDTTEDVASARAEPAG